MDATCVIDDCNSGKVNATKTNELSNSISTTACATAKQNGRDQSAHSTNDAAMHVLTDSSLLQSITACMMGVPYSAYLVKQQLECLRDFYEAPPPQDIELWQTAVRTNDRQTLEALAVLSKTESVRSEVCRVLYGILEYALVHTKEMELLEWLDTSDRFSEGVCLITDGEDEALGEQGDLAIIEWLWSRDYTFDSSIAIGAARGGHLALIQRLHTHETHTFGVEYHVIEEAVKHGHLDIVKYIYENRHGEINNSHYVRYLSQQSLLDRPAAAGELDMVTYLHTNNIGCATKAAIEGAVANRHVDVIKYLFANGLASKPKVANVIDSAVENGHDDVVQLLFTDYEQRCSGQAMERAMDNADMVLLHKLCAYHSAGALQHAILAAAKLNRVKFVRFLVATAGENLRVPREGLVNDAARAGHLDLIKYFHEHDDYFRFSAQTMRNAAVENHLHVVKFLHEHRTEGCTVDALFECEARSPVRVLQFLCTHRPMRNPAKAIARARRLGYVLLAAKLEHGASAATTFVYK